ncbi:uncharacterized protein LOC114759039 isoform X1 [Neltuma alba]|uniref:uncharacterized protein LOC114759039 isoform X1 n=1 Tax=Neltuma alba TaxID=207710 RepID=UPI0010A47050|nr:uncharacterized protein LOC114759039 isoform X1 [Prosopis alba]
MEESGKLPSEENKGSMEKNKKRKLKTPAQVYALEKFYNEHKYPTEEMKLELAEEVGLTEKQVSGWFCHRRLKDKRLLKDEAFANGRPDISSGVIQDHGSGLGQDSCGSTKHCDYRHLDPKEVESRGLYGGHDILVSDMAYERRNHYSENVGAMDETSSESSSSLQEKDSYDAEPSGYLTPDGALPTKIPKAATNMRYKPSGYLKVKGEIENPVITSVKKQLGRNYREDGPLLGIEFDPLPPGAFECKIADPFHETYYMANRALNYSPEISAVKRQPGLCARYDSYNTELYPEDSHMEGENLSDFQDKKSHQHSKQRPPLYSHTFRFPSTNSSLDMYEHSVGEAPAYNRKDNRRVGIRHGFEGLKSDYASNHSDHYDGNLAANLKDSLLHGYDNVDLKNAQSEYVKPKPSNLIRNPFVSMDTKDRGGLPSKMIKEKKSSEKRKARKQSDDPNGLRMLSHEVCAAKRLVGPPLQYNVQEHVAEMQPHKSQRSSMEVSSSFSEDETANPSSSLDEAIGCR